MESGRRVVSARGPVLGGRFVALKAARHSGRGAGFEGYDRRSGAPVVLAQARAHVAAGRQCRDRLRREAALLARLAASGLAPRRWSNRRGDGGRGVVASPAADLYGPAVTAPTAGIGHGPAGPGIAQLHLWLVSGDRRSGRGGAPAPTCRSGRLSMLRRRPTGGRRSTGGHRST